MQDFIPFSKRYKYINPENILKKNYENMTPELKIRIWNGLFKMLNYIKSKSSELFILLIQSIWDKIFKQPINQLDENFILLGYWIERFETKYKNLDWYKAYDLIEYVSFFLKINFPHFLKIWENIINQILTEEIVPYRMIEGKIVPITNNIEIETIKEAFVKTINDKFEPVREHLEKALNHLSDRKTPDYENCIKESISALESLVNILLNTQEKTLTALHQKVCSKYKCPSFIEKQIKEYYDWASKNVRHGNIRKNNKLWQEEAKLFLVQITSLINYFIAKSSKFSH